jgi:hypothetical protein
MEWGGGDAGRILDEDVPPSTCFTIDASDT